MSGSNSIYTVLGCHPCKKLVSVFSCSFLNSAFFAFCQLRNVKLASKQRYIKLFAKLLAKLKIPPCLFAADHVVHVCGVKLDFRYA